MKKFFVIAGLLLLVPMGFNSCADQRFDNGTGSSTTTGNPLTAIYVTKYQVNASDSLSVCPSKLILVPSASGSQNIEIAFSNPQGVSITSSGGYLPSLNIPVGSYQQVMLELADACGGGSALGVTNTSGSFQTAQTLQLSFAGQGSILASGSRLDLNVQAIVNNLQTVTSSADVSTEATASSGAFLSETWLAMSTTSAPPASDWAQAIWTGSQMIAWGGCNTPAGGVSYEQCQGQSINTGALYNPNTDTWAPISTVNAPSARHGFAMVWTGSNMLIWGGGNDTAPFENGGVYNPTTDTWTAMSTVNAPTTGTQPAFVWTGTEMIVWSGGTVSPAPAGGRYNPTSGTWATMSTVNAPPATEYSVSVWTGSKMLVWGGVNSTGDLNTGGVYDPALDQWTAITQTGAPSARYQIQAVWTGTEMIVWGGADSSNVQVNDGFRYNPTTDSWTAMTATNAPPAMSSYSEVWTGQEMIVWGSGNNQGYAYNPTTDTWLPISPVAAPAARENNAAVWSGSAMIVWGGQDPTGQNNLNTGGLYFP